jgi:endonuclease-8
MEGPSLIILKEELKPFVGKKVLKVSGNTRQPKELLGGRVLKRVRTWGKVLFMEFTGSAGEKPILTRTHFMMFGSYRIDDPKENRDPRLELQFANGILYFYACAFRFVEKEEVAALDRKVDVLSRQWDEKHVLDLLKTKKDAYLCDLFLDQNLFAGSGNIVKNEVLFNLRCHPLTKLSELRRADWRVAVHAVREYCENFYKWKKKYELRRHWQVYRKHKCPLCGEKLHREKLGRFERSTFFCANDQCHPHGAKVRHHEVLPIQKSAATREARLDH